jgi:acetyltransferase-like isoleucine patch superfamily enzyme
MPLLERKSGWRLEDPLNLFRRVLIELYSTWVSKTYPFASKAANLSIHYGCTLSRSHAPRIKLGASVTIQKDVILRVQAPLDEEGDPILVFDQGCVIGPRCIVSAKNGVYLGEDVVLASSVLIQDHSHAYRDVAVGIRKQGVTDGGKIRIGKGCWIGDGAVIHCDEGELTLGANCVVAPHSLVNRSFPSHSMIAGNPARVVKQFDSARGVWVLGSSRTADPENVEKQFGPAIRS